MPKKIKSYLPESEKQDFLSQSNFKSIKKLYRNYFFFLFANDVYQSIVLTVAYLCLVMFFLHSFIQPYTSGTSSCRYPGCKDWVVYSPKWRRFPLHISKYLAGLCLRGTAEVEIYTGMRRVSSFKEFRNVCVCYAHQGCVPRQL